MGMLRYLNNESISAARLLGASAAELERLGTLPDPADQDLIARYTDRVRTSLGRRVFARAFTQGKKMDLADAIAEARR
jgi:hypothetical protein